MRSRVAGSRPDFLISNHGERESSGDRKLESGDLQEIKKWKKSSTCKGFTISSFMRWNPRLQALKCFVLKSRRPAIARINLSRQEYSKSLPRVESLQAGSREDFLISNQDERADCGVHSWKFQREGRALFRRATKGEEALIDEEEEDQKGKKGTMTVEKNQTLCFEP
uniref:Uncharacterized protein n=1 Tax=Steinernema glaseri TaxID=37863 RepID=A0A1I8A531_9BILA